MKYLYQLILVVALLLALSLPVRADEPAKYNFASAQSSQDIRVTPNGEGQSSIYFYNIDGNRITHIVLEVSRAPAGWQVTIEPPLVETQVEIGGKIVTVNETLYIEPSQALSEKVENLPAGTVCIAVPPRGFALAKEAQIFVRVPASEKIGTKGEIVISATAQWLGQSGAVAIRQNRDFNFSVEVVAEASAVKEKVLGPARSGISGKWLPWIIGAAVVLLGVILVPLYIRRRRD